MEGSASNHPARAISLTFVVEDFRRLTHGHREEPRGRDRFLAVATPRAFVSKRLRGTMRSAAPPLQQTRGDYSHLESAVTCTGHRHYRDSDQTPLPKVHARIIFPSWLMLTEDTHTLGSPLPNGVQPGLEFAPLQVEH